jgi:hypothetical protein
MHQLHDHTLGGYRARKHGSWHAKVSQHRIDCAFHTHRIASHFACLAHRIASHTSFASSCLRCATPSIYSPRSNLEGLWPTHHRRFAPSVESYKNVETLNRNASHRIASHRIASHRIASHRIASHRIASHRIASHRIASHPRCQSQVHSRCVESCMTCKH